MSKTAIREKWGIAVAVVSFILVVFLDVHAIWVIIGGAVCGIAYGLFEKERGLVSEAVDNSIFNIF